MVIEFYYHSVSPASCIVWMTLKEIGVECKENVIDLMTGEQRSEEYKKTNPHLQVPAIKDGELVLSESRAIAIYLCQKYEKVDKTKKLYPTDKEQMAKFNRLLFRDVDNYNLILKYTRMMEIMEGRAKGPDESLFSKAKGVFVEYEALLANQDYIFGGHLTILDFACLHTLATMEMTGFGFDNYPKLMTWRERLAKLPYFEDCAEKPIAITKAFWKDLLEKGPTLFHSQ